jgi:hypothetical protein
MRTSAAIISSFAALAACAPLHARTIPTMGGSPIPHVGMPAVPAVGVPVPHFGLPSAPEVDEPEVDVPEADLSLGGYAKRQGLDTGLDLDDVTDELDLDNVTDELDLEEVTDEVNLDDIIDELDLSIKRDVGVPIVSILIYK